MYNPPKTGVPGSGPEPATCHYIVHIIRSGSLQYFHFLFYIKHILSLRRLVLKLCKTTRTIAIFLSELRPCSVYLQALNIESSQFDLLLLGCMCW